MPKTSPPAPLRHLRLVPPLAEADDAPMLDAPLPAWRLTTARAAWVGQRLRWATVGVVLGAVAWGASTLSRRASTPTTSRAAPSERGPHFAAYARGEDPSSLGRPLHEGDVLTAHDHVVVAFHNGFSPGEESAAYAAVFAINEAYEVAAVYPAPSPQARVMALPPVNFLALLDGPQLDSGGGPLTLLTVFLRQALPIDVLARAVGEAAADPRAFTALSEAPEVGAAIIRSQSMRLNHAPLQPSLGPQ